MFTLKITCDDEALLGRIARAAMIDLTQIDIMTKQPSERREAKKAIANTRITKGAK